MKRFFATMVFTIFTVFTILATTSVLVFTQPKIASATGVVLQETSISQKSAEVTTEVLPPTAEQWQAFLSALGGAKGLGTLGVIGVVVQGLLLALRSQIGAYAGRYRLVAVALLTFVTGGVGLKLSGLDWASVLMHSSTLLAFQVLLNQVFKQFVVKSDEPAKL